MDKILDFKMAEKIFIILHSLVEKNAVELADSYESMIAAAIDYATIRANWNMGQMKHLINMNEMRTSSHDIFIMSVEKLATSMTELNLDTEWRELLGQGRKRLGDFACYLTFATGMGNR